MPDFLIQMISNSSYDAVLLIVAVALFLESVEWYSGPAFAKNASIMSIKSYQYSRKATDDRDVLGSGG